jgi:hypothetical protein
MTMSLNPFRFVSRKVVDMTLATEVKRLREAQDQSNRALAACLARESVIIGAIAEICEQNDIKDNNGTPIKSITSFLDFANALAKVQS